MDAQGARQALAKGSPKFRAWGGSRKRQDRKQNQYAWSLDAEACIFALNGGMGGHECAALASRAVTQAMRAPRDREANLGGPYEKRLGKLVFQAYRRVHALPGAMGHQNNLGSTTLAFFLWQVRCHRASVGENHAYRLCGHFVQLNRSHILIHEYLAADIIDQEEIACHPQQSPVFTQQWA